MQVFFLFVGCFFISLSLCHSGLSYLACHSAKIMSPCPVVLPASFSCDAVEYVLSYRFDAVASGAEEVPKRSPSSVPVGIFAAMAFTTVFFMLLVRIMCDHVSARIGAWRAGELASGGGELTSLGWKMRDSCFYDATL